MNGEQHRFCSLRVCILRKHRRSKMSIGPGIVISRDIFCQYVEVGFSRNSMEILNYLKKLINFGHDMLKVIKLSYISLDLSKY